MCRKRILSTILCGALVCSLAACGSTGTDSVNENVTEAVENETDANTVTFSDSEFSSTSFTGTVTSIDGQTVTLSVAVMDGEPVSFGSMEPGGAGGEGHGGNVPDMPGGDKPDEPDRDASDMPGGDKPDGNVPDMPEGNTPDGRGDMEMETITVFLTIGDESVLLNSNGETAALSDIDEGSFLAVELDSDLNILSITISDMTGKTPGGGTSGVDSYDALQEFTEDTEVSEKTYASTGTDENAVHIFEGATATLNDVTVTRDSDDSTGGDNSSFYGIGAALLVSDGTAYINGCTINTDAAGGAGIFSYGSGIAYVRDTTIKTVQDTSGGIHVAGGGTLYAWNLDVETNGESSAAIRSDRGSGTMVVEGGTYTSNGIGSPAVYCTADITINNVVLTATGSEVVCIEGLNNLRLFDCDLSGSMQENSQNDCIWNVIVYQSMSGDSEVGNGTFSMSGGSITANNGGMFYTTNTECTFYLSDVDINYAAQNEFFLRCTGNANARGWGQSGNNGSQCNFTADNQTMEGDIIYDSISTLDFYMKNGSTLQGAFIDDESYAGNRGEGFCNVYISEDSTWTVTGDSVITSLYNEGTIVDESGNIVTIAGTDGTVYVKGSSPHTITVENYAVSADMSDSTDSQSFAAM